MFHCVFERCERSRACRQRTERVTLNLGTEPNNAKDIRGDGGRQSPICGAK